MDWKKFGLTVGAAVALAIALVNWPAIGVFVGVVLALVYGRQEIVVTAAGKTLKFFQVFLMALGVAMITQAIMTMMFGASLEVLRSGSNILAALRDPSLIGEAILKEFLALLVVVSATYLFVTADKPQKWVFKGIGALAFLCLCLSAWDAHIPLKSEIKDQRRQTLVALREAVASKTIAVLDYYARRAKDQKALADSEWGVAKVPTGFYNEQGSRLADIQVGAVVQRLDLKADPIPIGDVEMVKVKTDGQDKDFVSGEIGFVPLELFDWTQDRPLEVASKMTSQPAAKEPVPEPVEKKIIEMEPLAPPDEELQTTKSSVAEQPMQEATVHFKAGQRTLTGVMVKPGDRIRFFGVTAAFQVESKAAGGFAKVSGNKNFIANESSELKIYGLDRDGQVHIRVVSQR